MAMLTEAAKNGDIDLVRSLILLANTADVNEKEYRGYTSLMFAASNGHFDICELLVTKGAVINTKTNDGNTALMSGAYEGLREICKLLVNNGADINITDKYGDTALLVALFNGQVDICSYLCSIALYQVHIQKSLIYVNKILMNQLQKTIRRVMQKL